MSNTWQRRSEMATAAAHLESRHQATDLLAAKDAEEVVLKAQEVARASGVALPGVEKTIHVRIDWKEGRFRQE